jgi:hypothetical protein
MCISLGIILFSFEFIYSVFFVFCLFLLRFVMPNLNKPELRIERGCTLIKRINYG